MHIFALKPRHDATTTDAPRRFLVGGGWWWVVVVVVVVVALDLSGRRHRGTRRVLAIPRIFQAASPARGSAAAHTGQEAGQP